MNAQPDDIARRNEGQPFDTPQGRVADHTFEDCPEPWRTMIKISCAATILVGGLFLALTLASMITGLIATAAPMTGVMLP